MTRKCKRCGREIERGQQGFWKDLSGILPYKCMDLFHNHIPEKKPKKAICKKCGCKIIKTNDGWIDPLSSFPLSCEMYYDRHIPKEKEIKISRCKRCGRMITKKGKNWKDNTEVAQKYCYDDLRHLKHIPAE